MEQSGHKQAGPGKVVGHRQKKRNRCGTFRLKRFETGASASLLASNPSSCFAGKRLRSFAARSFSTVLAICGERRCRVARLQNRRRGNGEPPHRGTVPARRTRVGRSRIFRAMWRVNKSERAGPCLPPHACGGRFPERRASPRRQSAIFFAQSGMRRHNHRGQNRRLTEYHEICRLPGKSQFVFLHTGRPVRIPAKK